ncbi:STAS domain-containing protein [Novosphingobium cyanobacteriorum]|uniref:STAS domain-containing protein n=1 Tax=Novosphingobium cyanobacteriorum TaxID=3024215 RepID=A0ABT6CK70_9SPHN|nr:STAS domain-containing protein [Novosphingobium cyanobacteriorum]MDF8334297.1 STAS domain-containing protein [Novosphingobium cyanobacteriorum]
MPTITLPSRCDRAAAEALLPEMVAALGSGVLHIDARECTQIGQVMLQLLVSARRTGDGANIQASPVLRDTARQFGLDAELFDEVAA